MTDSRTAQRREPAAIVLLIALYLLSRGLFYLAGVRFDLAPLATSWQILDPVLLHSDLLQSLLYMPGQPPLYNLVLGVVLKASAALGGGEWLTAALLRTLFGALALASCLLLYGLMRRLRVGLVKAWIVTAIFMCSPALVLYESLPYYTVMVLALLMTIAWLFHACMTHFTAPRAFALCVAMAVLIYTRSMFQIEWMLVLIAYAALVLPGHRRTVMLAATLPLLLVLCLYAKNVAVIGQFSTSDWMGMSLAKLTTLKLDQPTRQRLVAEGRMSSMALDDKAFDIPEAYEEHIGGVPDTGIAVLDDKRKSTGHINYNYKPYANISRMATHDATVALRTHPSVYLKSVGIAWLMFFRPSSDYPFLKANRDALGLWSQGYAKVVAGQPVYPANPKFDLKPGTIGLFIAAGYVLAALFGLGLVIRCLVRRRISADDATLIFLWLNLMYVSVIGNALEIDENQRFRFAVNPFIVALIVAALTRLAGTWRRRRAIPGRTNAA
ncbi:MAG: hypothetical protein PF501_10350 [Salinisphaera sp.]|nr:hypothetical protein [Salinisphaera sp.]